MTILKSIRGLRRRTTFLAVCGLAMLPAQCWPQGTEKPRSVTVGRETIGLPIPVDYVGTDDLPALKAIAEAATPSTHRLLFALYPKADIDAWQSGRPLKGERYFLIQTERQSEPQSVSPAEFASLKVALKQRVAQRLQGNDATANQQRADHQRELDANLRTLGVRIPLPPISMRLGETTILGLADEQPTSISTASATKLAATGVGQNISVLLASVSTVLLAKGKLINVYGYSRYEGPEDLRWLQDESRKLVAHFAAANR